MVGIIRYGGGNVYSVITGIKHIGEDVILIEKSSEFKRVKFLILPGVGNFKAGIEYLKKENLDEIIKEKVEKGIPVLGICLGLELFFEFSEEGNCNGLCILKGDVLKFKNKNLRIPHMGWNKVKIFKENPIFENIPDNSYFYFAHSYFVKPKDDISVGKTEYGIIFDSVIMKKNIVGVQFHPEKSGINGLNFLKNFLKCKWLQ